MIAALPAFGVYMRAKGPSAAPSPTQAVQAGETGRIAHGEGRRWVFACLPFSLPRVGAALAPRGSVPQLQPDTENLRSRYPPAWVGRAATTAGWNAGVAWVTAALQESRISPVIVTETFTLQELQ